MKKNAFKMLLGAALASLAMTTANSDAQTQPPGDFLNGFDNSTSGGPNSTVSWMYWYNGSGTVGLDTAVKKTGAGSLKITIPFTLPFRTPDQGAWFGNFDEIGSYDTSIVYDGTFFTNISYDILMDPANPVSSNNDFGIVGTGLLDAGTPAGARESGTTLIPISASNTWFTVNQPVHKTDGTYLSSPGVIGVDFVYSTYDNNSQNSFLTNPVTLHIDNLHVYLGPVTNPPPVLGITNISQGLNFVQGSISGQFDRQNIRNLSTTASYSWVGAATAGNPVTYSFTVAKWSAPDLTFHIFVNPVAEANGGASASDYNDTNNIIFQIGTVTNGGNDAGMWMAGLTDLNPLVPDGYSFGALDVPFETALEDACTDPAAAEAAVAKVDAVFVGSLRTAAPMYPWDVNCIARLANLRLIASAPWGGTMAAGFAVLK